MAAASNSVTLATLAKEYGFQLVGNGNVAIQALVHPRKASKPTDLIYAPDAQALTALGATAACAALVPEEMVIPKALLDNPAFGFLVTPRLRVGLARLLQRFEHTAWVLPGIHPTAVVHATAQVGQQVTIGPYSVVGPDTVIGDRTHIHDHVSIGAQVRIGQDVRLYSGVRVGDRVQVGHRVIVQFNAAIGSEGFSYTTEDESRHEVRGEGAASSGKTQPHLRIPSVGTVVLEDDVEVGANTCIDRGTLAETRIGRGTKIDNLVQVGHNNQVGDHCLLVSQVGLSGSCRLGNGVVLAGQAGLADHLTLGDGAIVMAKSGVMRDVEPGGVVGGTPAMPRKQVLETLVYTARLKETHQEMKRLQKQVKALQQQLEQLEKTLPEAVR